MWSSRSLPFFTIWRKGGREGDSEEPADGLPAYNTFTYTPCSGNRGSPTSLDHGKMRLRRASQPLGTFAAGRGEERKSGRKRPRTRKGKKKKTEQQAHTPRHKNRHRPGRSGERKEKKKGEGGEGKTGEKDPAGKARPFRLGKEGHAEHSN